MNNDYLIITGYSFKKKKDSIDDILKILLESDQAICSLDSCGVISFKGESQEWIAPAEKIKDYDEFIDNLDMLDKKQKEYLKEFNHYYIYESSLIESDIYKIKVKMKDFFVKYSKYNEEFKVSVSLVIYDNDMFNFIFRICFNKNINYIDFQHTLLYEYPEYVKMPKEYLDFSKVDCDINSMDNLLKIINNGLLINTIENFSGIISKYGELFVTQMRSSIFINEKNINKATALKLLYQSNIDIKNINEIKDYRLATDYFHYSDQVQSVIVGKKASLEINWIILLDTIIINDLLTDMTIYNNINENFYSLNELLSIQEAYDRNTSFKKYFPLVEANEYINSIFELLNKYDINQAITRAIERKKSERQAKKEFMISVLACILAIPVLYDYIIEPLTVWLHNIINTEDVINKISSPMDFIIITCMLLLSFFIIYLLAYRIDNKKEK